MEESICREYNMSFERKITIKKSIRRESNIGLLQGKLQRKGQFGTKITCLLQGEVQSESQSGMKIT